MNIATEADTALKAHREGNRVAAEAICRKILIQNPDHADTLHLLGLLLAEQGDWLQGIANIRRAILLAPSQAVYRSNLGELLRLSRNFTEARSVFEELLRDDPTLPTAWNGLGLVLEALGDKTRAMAAFRKAVSLNSGYAEAWHNLGACACEQGDAPTALAAFSKAVQVRPGFTPSIVGLGEALKMAGRWNEALLMFAKACQLEPGDPENWCHQAEVLRYAGKADDALRAYERALALRPTATRALTGSARLLREMGRMDEAFRYAFLATESEPSAVASWRLLGEISLQAGNFAAAGNAFNRALELVPNDPVALVNLAVVHVEQGLPGLALNCLDRMPPDYADTIGVLANRAAALTLLGQIDDGLALWERLVLREPDNWRWTSSLLYALNASDRVSAPQIASKHRELGCRLESSVLGIRRKRPAGRKGSQRLRIGFVSADLREHAVASFLEPLWINYDRHKLEIAAYSDTIKNDENTARLRGHVDRWRDIKNRSDAEVCNRIADDGIDILFDLGGHTAGNRLSLFALRPADIQASWLGYPNGTGMTCMDYRVTDAIADPPGSDALYVEKLRRMSGCAWCYLPPLSAPPVSGLPALASGQVTFCSFNNPLKISGRTLDLWAKTLLAVDRALLLLKGKQYADTLVKKRIYDGLGSRGISRERIVFDDWKQTRGEHLASYSRSDIALDTFPYHGTTTTCEALWMGVPVVVKAGDSPAAHVGASLIAHAGVDLKVATTDEDFVAMARQLAGDLSALASLRAGMRDRLRGSLLLDGPKFAESFADMCEKISTR